MRKRVAAFLSRHERGQLLLDLARKHKAPPVDPDIASAAEPAAPVDQTDPPNLFVLAGKLGDIAPAAEPPAPLDQTDPPNLFALAGKLASCGQHSEAIEALDRFIADHPDHVLAVLTRVQIQAHLGRYGEAFEGCRRVLQIEPGSVAALASLRQIVPALAAKADDPEMRRQATEAYRTLFAAQPDDVADGPDLGAILDALVGKLASCGRHPEALELLDQFIATHPDHVRALLTSIQIWAHMGRHREAFEGCRRVLRIEPGSGAALASLRQILPALAAEGDASQVREQAIEAYQTLIAAQPDNVASWLDLGAILDAQAREAELRSPIAALQHGSAERAAGIATPIPVREAPEAEARRLADSAPLEAKVLAEHVAKLESDNLAWARLISAQRDRLGYLDSLENWARYQQTLVYFRNLGLYTRKFELRMASPEPPSEIPESLLPRFTMDGRVIIERGYLNAAYPTEYSDTICEHDLVGFALCLTRRYRDLVGDRSAALTKAANERAGLFENVLARRAYGLERLPVGAQRKHPQVDAPVQRHLREAIREHGIVGRQVATITMLGPWIETLCLLSGAQPTRVSPTAVASRTPLLPCMTIADWERERPTFDHVIAYGTVEHRGLGRLGEPLDPDGDRDLLRHVADMLRPGGRLFLFLPIGRDTVIFNAGRVYGRIRLPYLLDGWRLVNAYEFAEAMLDGIGDKLTLLVLGKEAGGVPVAPSDTVEAAQ